MLCFWLPSLSTPCSVPCECAVVCCCVLLCFALPLCAGLCFFVLQWQSSMTAHSGTAAHSSTPTPQTHRAHPTQHAQYTHRPPCPLLLRFRLSSPSSIPDSVPCLCEPVIVLICANVDCCVMCLCVMGVSLLCMMLCVFTGCACCITFK
jgi:hypothetical protein